MPLPVCLFLQALINEHLLSFQIPDTGSVLLSHALSSILSEPVATSHLGQAGREVVSLCCSPPHLSTPPPCSHQLCVCPQSHSTVLMVPLPATTSSLLPRALLPRIQTPSDKRDLPASAFDV